MSRAERRAALPALVLALAAAGAGNAQQQTFDCELPDHKVVTRMVGARDVEHERYPWQVSIGSTAKGRNAALAHFCGGSLIGARWVLTAAHCVPISPGELRVVHGATDLRKPEKTAVTRGVAEAYPHPEYDGNPENGYDIALLRLSAPISNAKKSYAPLPVEKFAAQRSFPGACAVVTGWGSTQPRKPGVAPDYSGKDKSPVLQAAGFPLVDRETCRAAYPNEISAGSDLCAGLPQGGKDSCQGDSGGPLVVEGLGEGQYMQVGVVSWGLGCAEPGKYGVYARVSRYAPWILQTIRGQ